MTIRIKALCEERAKLGDENSALLDTVEKRDQEAVTGGGVATGLTDEEASAFDARQERIMAVGAEIDRREANRKQLSDWSEPTGRVGTPPAPAGPVATPLAVAVPSPAVPKRHSRLRHFQGPDAAERAHRFGTFCLAVNGNTRAIERCAEMGIPLLAATPHKESDNTRGGVWVPEELDADLIDLREQYGVFRRFARISRMMSDTKKRRRRTGGLTAHAVAEGGAGTHSKKGWDWVTLTAKDWQVITTVTDDLSEDATINIGDDLAGEMAYAFANKEDDCGFIGDGTSTFGKIKGVTPTLKGLSGTIANIAGLVVAAGNLYSEITLANFQSVVGKLPTFGDTPGARWFCHKVFWATVMDPLLTAAGGTTPTDLQNRRSPLFLGYPVEFTQVMPKVEANSQVCALLGDLSLAADFGDRKQTAISFSRDANVDSVSMFETSQLAIKGVERFDINVHDVGNASGTAANREPGPIVGLITAAS